MFFKRNVIINEQILETFFGRTALRLAQHTIVVQASLLEQLLQTEMFAELSKDACRTRLFVIRLIALRF